MKEVFFTYGFVECTNNYLIEQYFVSPNCLCEIMKEIRVMQVFMVAIL